MAYCSVLRPFIWFCVCLTLITTVVTEENECDELECYPMLAHYESLNCTPVYEKNHCCPTRYNCDHLYTRILERNKKCYIFGNEYKIGENFTFLDEHLCEKTCICISTLDDYADFMCQDENCHSHKSPNASLYSDDQLEQRNLTGEISSYIYDAEKGKSVCSVDGKLYLPGRYIKSINKTCICEGNKTDTSVPCRKFIRIPDIHAAADFYKNCAPVYSWFDLNETIGTEKKSLRCQDVNDTVIHHNKLDPEKDAHGPLSSLYCPSSELTSRNCKKSSKHCLFVNPEGPMNVTFDLTYRHLCKFGQLTMHIGDLLNTIEYDDHLCIVCFCAIPPVATCIMEKCHLP